MKKLKRIQSKFGHIDIFSNEQQTVIYAIPFGFVGPSLVKKDLDFLAALDAVSSTPYRYIVNTSQAKAVHPCNPVLLRALRQLSNMEEYIVYAPSPIIRFLLSLTNWINRPDRVITTELMLNKELE